MIGLRYRELKGWKYELLHHLSVPILIQGVNIKTPYFDVRDGYIDVRAGYAWDGPSGPTFDTPTFMRGSLVHDALYQAIAQGLLSKDYRKRADLELRRLCLQDGMNKFRASYVYWAVRIFGGMAVSKKRESRIKEI